MVSNMLEFLLSIRSTPHFNSSNDLGWYVILTPENTLTEILFKFGELLQIKKRLGKDKFPLIDQTYYPNHREMVNHEISKNFLY